MKATSEPTWLVIGLARNLYSGGSIRAGMIFKDLCANERAVAVRGRSLTDALRGLAGHPGMIRGPVNLATARMMPRLALKAAARLLETVAIDVHDHPVLQAAALGLPQSSSAASKTLRSYDDHVAAFRVLIAQTESFADLAGLPSDRTLIIPNGTDPGRFRPSAPPDMPIVGLVSGAAPGRGIELLIDAVREARSVVPDLTLRMALATTDPASRAYLRDLILRTTADPWITIVSLMYDEIPQFLESVSIAAIPHPRGDYMDAIVPVKLFDSMMSGRPLVVTPRIETVRVVTTHQAGEVAAGDAPGDMAEAIVLLAHDAERATRLGEHGRRAALSHYAWNVLSKRVTDHVTSPGQQAVRLD